MADEPDDTGAYEAEQYNAVSRRLTLMVEQALIEGVDARQDAIAEQFLSLKESCKHPEHRIQPRSFNDWRAVHNMMSQVRLNLAHHMGIVIEEITKMAEMSSIDHPMGVIIMNAAHQSYLTHTVMLNACNALLGISERAIGRDEHVDGLPASDARLHFERVVALMKEKQDKREKEHSEKQGKENEDESRTEEGDRNAREADRCTVFGRPRNHKGAKDLN